MAKSSLRKLIQTALFSGCVSTIGQQNPQLFYPLGRHAGHHQVTPFLHLSRTRKEPFRHNYSDIRSLVQEEKVLGLPD